MYAYMHIWIPFKGLLPIPICMFMCIYIYEWISFRGSDWGGGLDCKTVDALCSNCPDLPDAELDHDITQSK